MKTALVTGATGFVGSHLIAHLLEAGWQLKVLQRDAERLPRTTPVTAVEPTLHSSAAQWAPVLEGVDVVFHLAGVAHRQAPEYELERVNAQSPALLAGAAEAAGVESFVWLSSVKVLGETSAEPLSEAAVYAPADPYALSKTRGEQNLRELSVHSSFRLSIVRPPLIYGVGVKANFLALLSLARLAQRGLPLPLGAAQAPRSLLAVANLCDFLTLAATRGDGLLHVADPRDLSVVQLLERLCQGQHLRLWSVPEAAMRRLLRLAGREGIYRRLFEPLQLDCRDSFRRLDFHPALDSGPFLDEMMTWFLQR
jgi:UDP-glucose 4-epimerase